MSLQHILVTDKRCHYRVLLIEKIGGGFNVVFLRGNIIGSKNRCYYWFLGGVNAALPSKVKWFVNNDTSLYY
jgi:hypothetical protein